MIDDARLDQLVHAALEREADLSAARQPKLDQAVAKLVRRVGPSGVTTRWLVPVRIPALNLLVMLVLLLLALLAAVYVGSRLVSLPPVPPFGFAFPCDRGPVPGLALDGPRIAMVLSLVRDNEGETEIVQAYADGTYVRDLSVAGETRASTVTGALIERRRLTAEGLALLVGRVESVGLADGCRRLSTTSGAGALDLTTADGTAGVTWGTADNPRTRPVSEEEDAALVQLQLELTQPDSWLPESAWVDPAAEEVRPHHWLLVVSLHDTGYEPDAEVTLPNGDSIVGVDPRYELLAMPAGVEPAEFGAELALADPTAGTTLRCGRATTAEAEALNASLDTLVDEIGAGTDDEGLVYGPDVSMSVADVSVQPVYDPDYDCAALADDRTFFMQPHPTATPGPVTGNLAHVDVCSLVTADALMSVGATESTPWPNGLALGRPANSCVAFTGTLQPLEVWDPGISYPADWRALLALYPDRLTAGAAARVVESVLGEAVIEEVVAGGTMWPARCPADAVACLDLYATWGAERLVFIEFTGARQLPAGATPGLEPDAMARVVTPAAARAFVEAVLAQR